MSDDGNSLDSLLGEYRGHPVWKQAWKSEDRAGQRYTTRYGQIQGIVLNTTRGWSGEVTQGRRNLKSPLFYARFTNCVWSL